MHRLRWLVPASAVALLVLLAAGAWLLWRTPSRDVSGDAREKALALLARDDVESLEQGEQALDALGAGEKGLGTARADAALARVLRAGALADEAAALPPRIAARAAERDRLLRERPPGFEAAEAAAGAEIRTLQGQLESRQRAWRELAERARSELRRLETELGADLAVSRAVAMSAALAGDRDRTARAARAARADGAADPWAELAEASLDADADAAARDRARARLEALVTRHGDMLRARYLLASAQADAGRKQEAIATLDALVAANPKHERARRLRAELSVPSVQVVSGPDPAGKAPAEKPAAPARNVAAQPPPGPAAPTGAAPVAEPPRAPPAAVQPTAPLPPAQLPVAPPPEPVPTGKSVPEGAEGPAAPGAGGDAAGAGRRRERPPAPAEQPYGELGGG
jgi:uncharacterized protein YjiS (DUF1127 family)